MKHRQFSVGGLLFNVGDNYDTKHKPPRAEFEGKYIIHYFDDYYNQWRFAALTTDTKKEAVEIMKRRARNHDFPFNW